MQENVINKNINDSNVSQSYTPDKDANAIFIKAKQRHLRLYNMIKTLNN